MIIFQTTDILDIHSKVCPNFDKHVTVSVDGVSEAKSNSVSMDIYSSNFRKCRYIYPHMIVRPLKKGYVNNEDQLKKFISDITDNEVNIDCVCADNLKRANIKCVLNHAALFPCEYCFAKGVKCSEKRKKNDNPNLAKKLILDKIKKTQNLTDPDSKKKVKLLKQILKDLENCSEQRSRKIIVWPSSTANKELRTTDKIRDIVQKIDNEENGDIDPLTREEKKGVVGHSVLLDLENFDYVNNVPPEYMHLVCLGVVKRMTELTFNVGINRTRATNRKLSSTKLFNALMAKTKLLSEFSRRSRDLDFAVFKAEEFRNLILFFFPHVLSCIEKPAKEREIWLYLAFLVRSCIIPDSEYFNVSNNHISQTCMKFYKLYEKVFGPLNCTYSIHVFSSHLMQIRQLGPLTETSAFKFESFYGEVRNSFHPGTPSTLKQIFETIILKRSLTGHRCEKSIYLSNYDTAMTSDSLVYTYINDDYSMYKVIDENDDEVICNPQGKFVCQFEETPELCWSSVGVFKKGAASSEIVHISHNSIVGKFLLNKGAAATKNIIGLLLDNYKLYKSKQGR